MIDSLTSILPKVNDPTSIQGLAGNHNHVPLKALNGLYTGMKELIDLDYSRQKNEREN